MSTAAPNSIIVRFLDKVLEAIQAVEIQAFAEPFDSSNGTANHTTSYVIFYLWFLINGILYENRAYFPFVSFDVQRS